MAAVALPLNLTHGASAGIVFREYAGRAADQLSYYNHVILRHLPTGREKESPSRDEPAMAVVGQTTIFQ